ncbi:3-hydroxyacyl-ACP dehydratase FabZ [Geopsychrobacter electrodiphilus]|uniref:3-hydroxyacyl-ACP dehydratase FabZ n=1 Tax=Geopsychrobacter electrodiphilus TaxID=225196 RepID=UPI0003829F2E|nr:3-hydroxyacyl-ACP dehydratase FabZ [Geopsychrobacter electrodiphilus]
MISLDTMDILNLLPHRYPFLLIDRLEEVEEGIKCVGFKNVTINEPFFQGHFPGHPIMPGVLILEAMAQVGGAYIAATSKAEKEQVTYFVGINNARFRRPVRPGDQLRMEVEFISTRRGIHVFFGKAYVGESLVAEAELKATFVDK